MKKIALIIVAAAMTFTWTSAQNVDDALRYSQIFYNGTARFMSMGGAFTALGADLSSISLNPAGTGVFRTSEVSLTPQLNYINTSTLFNNSSSSDFGYKFGLSQAGVVSNIFSNGNKTGLISLNAAYSYNMTNNFNKRTNITGFSDNSSMADYWAARANGYSKAELEKDGPFASWIASKTYIIDYLPGSTKSYGTVFSQYGDSAYATYGQNIRRIIENEGYSGEHTFSIGGNYSNKLFFGLALGINSLKYIGHYEHLESDVDDVIYDFKNFNYTDHLYATGTGISLKIGTIFRPVEYLRIGLAIHSPVIYRITEYYNDNITSAFDTEVDGVSKYEMSNDQSRYKYTLTTPFRINAGVALQVKKMALLSADYEFVDYRISRFSNASDNYDYYEENDGIQNILKATSNFRLGTEFRFNSLYARGGYSYYGKAFDPNEQNKDLDYNAISLGLGFRQQNFFFDLAFTGLYDTSNYYMYYDPPYLSPANIETSRNSFMATVGFKF